MSGLLPSTPDLARDRDPDPRLIGLDSDDASTLLSALSSDTARELFCALHEEPATPSALADQVDTSLQNAQYHLEKLEAADLIEEVGTQYSQKGREMSIYAPSNGPLIVYPGEDSEPSLRKLFGRLVSGLAIVGVLAAIIEGIARGMLPGLGSADDAPVEEEMEIAVTDAPEAAPAEQAHWLVEAIAGLPPGVLFFLGGMLVLLVGLAIWYRKGVLVR